MAGHDAVVMCPVCGARSKNDGFGREGTRVLAPYLTPKSVEPGIVSRRQRAERIRYRNRNGGVHRIDAEVRRAIAAC